MRSDNSQRNHHEYFQFCGAIHRVIPSWVLLSAPLRYGFRFSRIRSRGVPWQCVTWAGNGGACFHLRAVAPVRQVIILMLLGRLELYTILVLVIPWLESKKGRR